jgi:hypothetical protein
MTADQGTAAKAGRLELRDVAVSFPTAGGERLLALSGIDLMVEP